MDVLEIEVVKCISLIAPSKLKKLKHPFVEVTYSSKALKDAPIESELDSSGGFLVGSVFHFPYRRDENYFRIRVYDRESRDVGFADVALPREERDNLVNKTEIRLGGTQGEAGQMLVHWRIALTPLTVVPNITKGTLVAGPPVATIKDRSTSKKTDQHHGGHPGGSSDCHRSKVKRGESDLELSENEEMLKGHSSHKSLRVYVTRGFDFHSKGQSTISPYVVALLGKQRAVGQTIENSKTSPELHTIFNFPYNNERYLNLQVFDRHESSEDRQIGTAKVDLSAMRENPTVTHSIEVKLKKAFGESGVLALNVSFLEGVCERITAVTHKNPPVAEQRVLHEGSVHISRSPPPPSAMKIAPTVASHHGSHHGSHVDGHAGSPPTHGASAPSKHPRSSGDRAAGAAGVAQDSDASDVEAPTATKLPGWEHFRCLEIMAVSAEKLTSHHRKAGTMDPCVRVSVNKKLSCCSAPRENAGENPKLGAAFYIPFEGQARYEVEVLDAITLLGKHQCAHGDIDLHSIWPRLSQGVQQVPLTVPLESADKKAVETPLLHLQVTARPEETQLRVVNIVKDDAKSGTAAHATAKSRSAAPPTASAKVGRSVPTSSKTLESVRVTCEELNIVKSSSTSQTFKGRLLCSLEGTELMTKLKLPKLRSAEPASVFVFPYSGERQALVVLTEKRSHVGKCTPLGGAAIDVGSLHGRSGMQRVSLDLMSPSNNKVATLVATVDFLDYAEKPYCFLAEK